MNWYLLQTKPHAYVIACENLRRQGFDVFLPYIIKTTKKNSKFLDVKAPLFPGYLFLGTSIDPVPWRSVNGTRGISKATTLDGSGCGASGARSSKSLKRASSSKLTKPRLSLNKLRENSGLLCFARNSAEECTALNAASNRL